MENQGPWKKAIIRKVLLGGILCAKETAVYHGCGAILNSAKPQIETNFVISEKEIFQIARELPSSPGVSVSPENACLPQRKGCVCVGGVVVVVVLL